MRAGPRLGRSRASASVGSLGAWDIEAGNAAAPLPAPRARDHLLAGSQTPRLGSRPACRAGSRSGHDELLVRAGAGGAGCPSRPVTEGHVPPRRGRTWLPARGCLRRRSPHPSPPPPPVFEAIFKGCASYPGPSQTLDAIRWQPPWCKM